MMRARQGRKWSVWAVCLFLLSGSLLVPSASFAKTPQEIDASVNAALVQFSKHVNGAQTFLQDAKGVFVLANVLQAGIGIGGEYGEGALRIHGRTVAYYNIGAGSVGFQWGAQEKDIILVFLQDKALSRFRAKSGWQAGVDGSIVVVNVGAGASVNTMKFNQPIVGFVVDQKGLMYNLTLEGSKITRLKE